MKKLSISAIFILYIFITNAQASELFETINERLSYMEDVALYKSRNRLPVEDINREQIVTDNARIFAIEKGLDPNSIEQFFKAQISVAKAIQYRYRAYILSHPTGKKPKNLQTEVRPKLLQLGNRINELILKHIETHGSFEFEIYSDFDSAIKVEFVSDSDKKYLFESLVSVKKSNQNVLSLK